MVPLVAKRIQLIKAIAEKEHANDDNVRVVKYAAMSIEVLREFKIRLQREKVAKLSSTATHCFRELVEKDSLVSEIKIDPTTLFDVQAKRLHEYKRQLLNVLKIISLFHDLKENPDLDVTPQTFIFGAKASPGYVRAKQIITLICSVADLVNSDPEVNKILKVVFIENYSVSNAQLLMPAADISEQISLAGKEASGTGCMKLMINGAITIGTLDGANVEMAAAVGNENIYIFGLTASEVDDLWLAGYNSALFYARNDKLRRIVDRLNAGFAGESFSDIASYLLAGHGVADPYMCLADFDSYRLTHEKMYEDYLNREDWTRRSLINIAKGGFFAADRAVRDYAENIWKITPVKK